MKTTKVLLILSMLLVRIIVSAQIGYQVSLLNSATGEPRVAETVSVNITLTNKEGTTILQETQTATTNDFGILSLSVGNSSTFDDVDWSKLPFFISVSVGGKLVGKSQVLTVPIAEYAKKTGILTKEMLLGKAWEGYLFESEDFYRKYQCNFGDNSFTLKITNYEWDDLTSERVMNGTFVIDGNDVVCTFSENGALQGLILKFSNNALYSFDGYKSFVLQ